jgi:hypothetical protein
MGDYRIVKVAQAEQRPARCGCSCRPWPSRVRGALVLYLPRSHARAEPTGRRAGGQATPRPYGTEFAQAEKPFFLVLHDAWFDELQTRPVTL